MSDNTPIVLVIDDDLSVREALGSLLRSTGMNVALFGSIEEFLAHPLPNSPRCLVLDVRLPGHNGLDFQTELANQQISIPIIFITGHGDIPMSVRAMKGGAVEFLTKPFYDQHLLEAIHHALEKDKSRWQDDQEIQELRTRYESMSLREREVMSHVVLGGLNKQIAADLNVSEITVKVHRGQVMRKMQARSLVSLVRMADRLGVSTKACDILATTDEET